MAERWIVAALRHRKFFSLEELNEAIRELLDKLNQRPSVKAKARGHTVRSLDKPALKPLPGAFRSERMVAGQRQHRLSRGVRRELLQRAVQPGAGMVEIRSTPTTVEIFHKGSAWRRICARAARADRHHRRASAKSSSGASGMDALADGALGRTIGPHTARLFERIMDDKPHPEMGYRGCLGIIRLAEVLAQRVEAAAERRLLTGACRYQSVESILKNSLDQQPLVDTDLPPAPPPPHDNIRGAEYFE